MERAPRQDVVDAEFEVVEVDGWRQLVEVASVNVDELIASIEGFENMDAKEQLRVLQARLLELSDESKDPDFNRNRALVEEIAKRMMTIEATSAFQAAMDRLEQSRPTGGRILTEA